jgi:hypothetical protein
VVHDDLANYRSLKTAALGMDPELGDGRKQGFGTCPESRSGNAIRSVGELIHRCREISEGRSESRVSMREMSDALLTAQC